MKEVQNILRILKETRSLINSDNLYEIKSLSDQTIHTAAISQDPDNIVVAVLVYSISKVLQREYYKKMDGWTVFYSSLKKNLDLAIRSLEADNVANAMTYLGRIRESLNKLSSNLGEYIQDVFRKAEINKAFKLYEHGISAEQTAKLLGISLWDISSYIGQSSISDAKASISLPVKKRIKIAEDIFR